MTLQHLDTIIAFTVVMLGASLLITIFTQLMSALFAHRGTNLRWGLQVLLKTINPNLGDQAKKSLAEEILTHPILSDSVFTKVKNIRVLGTLTRRWRLASAVRVEELIRILPAIAQNMVVSPADKAAAKAAVPSAGAQAVTDLIRTGDPSAARTVKAFLGLLQGLGPDQSEEARKLIQQMTGAAQGSLKTLKNDVDVWFNSAMDRVSQRFMLQMRLWTIVFSVLLVFAAHLDVFRLVTQLSTDAELRSRLVGSADAMTKQAAGILPSQPGGATAKLSVVPGIYSDQMKQLKTQEAAATKNLSDLPSFDSREAAIKWLRAEMNGDSQTERLVTEYGQLVDAGLKTDADKLLDQSAGIKNILAKAGYQLVPDPYPQPWYKPWETFTAREFWGTMIAAGLLSLGAPFWFNALKTLSSLRPLVATKEKTEQEEKRKLQAAA